VIFGVVSLETAAPPVQSLHDIGLLIEQSAYGT
jgi:hypothetical protein